MTDKPPAKQRVLKPQRERTTVHNAEVTDKERQALELRKAGATFDAIARQLGFADPSGAHRAVSRAIERIPAQAVNEFRAVDVERLDRLFLAVWQPALGGDLKALDRALRILDQRAKLLGLNTTVKAEMDVTVTERSQVDIELQELLNEVRARNAAQEAPQATPTE